MLLLLLLLLLLIIPRMVMDMDSLLLLSGSPIAKGALNFLLSSPYFPIILLLIIQSIVFRYLAELLAERQKLGPFLQVLPQSTRLLTQEIRRISSGASGFIMEHDHPDSSTTPFRPPLPQHPITRPMDFDWPHREVMHCTLLIIIIIIIHSNSPTMTDPSFLKLKYKH